MTETVSPEPIADEGLVDFAGIVQALEISAEDRGVLKGSLNEEETPVTEAGEVSIEGAGTEAETKEEEPELEPTPPKEEEGEGEPKEEEPKQEELDPDSKLPVSVQKRIDKLTRQNYEASEKIATLESQLAQANQTPAGTPQAPGIMPLSDVQDYVGLQQRRDQALTVKEWALGNPNGGTFTVTNKEGKAEEVIVSEEKVREMLINSNRMLDRDIPARKEYLDQAVQYTQVAKQAYPNLFNPEHPDAKTANNILVNLPWLRNLPNHAVIIGDALEGARVREARAQKPQGTPVAGSKVVPLQNGVKPKVIGSPKSQAGPKVRAAGKTVAEVAKEGREISVEEASELVNSFFELR